MKRLELAQDITSARQTLVESLVSLSDIVLDGTRDDEDGKDLAMALDQVHNARNTVELVLKRLQFLQKLERLRSGSITASGRWHTVSLVRLGVDCGYAIDDVNRIVEAALGVVIKQAEPPAVARQDDHVGIKQGNETIKDPPRSSSPSP